MVDPELVENPSRCLLLILCQSREVLIQGVHVYGVSVQLLERPNSRVNWNPISRPRLRSYSRGDTTLDVVNDHNLLEHHLTLDMPVSEPRVVEGAIRGRRPLVRDTLQPRWSGISVATPA